MLLRPFTDSLQWSHVLTNVETKRVSESHFVCKCPSMEPRPHERGNPPLYRSTGRGEKSFNGATSSRTWKLTPPSRMSPGLRLLQWSHVLTNVETILPTGDAVASKQSFNGATSSRTWKPSSTRQTTSPTSTFLQWSHVLTNVETKRRAAGRPVPSLPSMEPRPHERGNAESGREDLVAEVFLQWSHVLTNVETQDGPRRRFSL